MTRRPPRPTLFPHTTLSRSAPYEAPNTAILHSAATPDTPLFASSISAANQPAAAYPEFEEAPRTPEIIPPLFQLRCTYIRSEEHTSELQSLAYLVCRLLLEK